MSDKSMQPKTGEISSRCRYDRFFHQRIETISDADFAAALRPLPGLAGVLAAFAAGRPAEAWGQLGAWHAKALAAEIELLRAGIFSRLQTPAAQAASQAAAADVLRRDFAVWHTHRVQFPREMDFLLPMSPSVYYGFQYFGWFKPLLDQFVATGEARYARDALAIVRRYYDQRREIPRLFSQWSPVWYELGSGAKSHVFLHLYLLVCGDNLAGPAEREALLKFLLGFARHLYRVQGSGPRPGNWQIQGCSALYLIGAFFPEFREAAAWRRRAETMLAAHARHDFSADGGASERCGVYSWISLRGLAEFYELACRRGFLEPGRRRFWRAFLKRGFQWFARHLAPGLRSPAFNDGGIFDMSQVIAHGRRIFPEWRQEPEGFACGVDRGASCLQASSGFAIMRAGNPAPAGPYMAVNFAPSGGTHTHPGLLDFSLWCHGRPLLDEVGRFGDYDGPLNPLFRSPQAHNQVLIEYTPMERAAHAGREPAWFSSPVLDMFSAWHEAFAGFRIQRQIAFLKPGCWLVHDTVTAGWAMRQVSSYLHAPAPFEILGPGLARTAGSPGCLVQFAEPESLGRLFAMEDYGRAEFPAIEPGKQSHNYLFAEERQRLVAQKWHVAPGRRPVSLTMLLVPFAGAEPPVCELRKLPLPGAGETAAAFRVLVPGQAEALVVFNPARDDIALPQTGPRTTAMVAAYLDNTWSFLA